MTTKKIYSTDLAHSLYEARRDLTMAGQLRYMARNFTSASEEYRLLQRAANKIEAIESLQEKLSEISRSTERLKGM